jgi:hypothetical protein
VEAKLLRRAGALAGIVAEPYLAVFLLRAPSSAVVKPFALAGRRGSC